MTNTIKTPRMFQYNIKNKECNCKHIDKKALWGQQDAADWLITVVSPSTTPAVRSVSVRCLSCLYLSDPTRWVFVSSAGSSPDGAEDDSRTQQVNWTPQKHQTFLQQSRSLVLKNASSAGNWLLEQLQTHQTTSSSGLNNVIQFLLELKAPIWKKWHEMTQKSTWTFNLRIIYNVWRWWSFTCLCSSPEIHLQVR